MNVAEFTAASIERVSAYRKDKKKAIESLKSCLVEINKVHALILDDLKNKEALDTEFYVSATELLDSNIKNLDESLQEVQACLHQAMYLFGVGDGPNGCRIVEILSERLQCLVMAVRSLDTAVRTELLETAKSM